MIPEQKVIVKWNGASRKHYESLGYVYTKRGDEFEVEINELTKASNVFVRYICDYCNGDNQQEEKDKYAVYNNLMNHRKKLNKDACRHCAGKKLSEYRLTNVPKENSLAYVYPEICNQWNYEKNEKNPTNFTAKSGQVVWWICSKGHEWEDRIINITSGKHGCPYCSNHRVCNENCLATIFPEIAAEWHPTKNDKLTPYNVASKSNKKVWWKCKIDPKHEWKSAICDRAVGQSCPECAESKGEKLIKKYLESKEINFVNQYEFEDLKGIGGKNLRFDVAIIRGGSLILIEYDGIFHFGKIYVDDDYERLVEHDKRKNIYCLSNNINLIRIPYWEMKNIHKIMDRVLGYFGLIDFNFDKLYISKFLVNHPDWTEEKYKTK